MNQNELTHYGVKGMKWGVRRYQNYDGSYTQRGLSRFRKAEQKYDEAKSKRDEAKARGDKNAEGKARAQMGTAKNEMTKSYKNLKMDKRADQGKKLYAEGKRMRANSMMGAAIRQSFINAGAVAAANTLQRLGVERKTAAGAGVLISTGGTAVNAIVYGRNDYINKRLSAYYGH